MNFKLDGMVGLITGAGGMNGIGRAIALRLAEMGADVALTDIKRDMKEVPDDEVAANWKGIESVRDEVKKLGRRSEAFYCDITQEDQVRVLVEDTIKHLGSLHILVNNARAIIGKSRVPVFNLGSEEWDRTMAVNLRGMFYCCKYGAKEMIKNKSSGRIINIGSSASKRGFPNSAAYVASKFGVVGLTQAIALDLAPYNITVNAVCPGPTDTHRFDYGERAIAQKEGVSLDEVRRRVLSERARGIPLGRVGTPDDVAAMTAFLVSPEAAFITGQSINISGGAIMD